MNYCPSSQKTTESHRKPSSRPQPLSKPNIPARPSKGSIDKTPVKKPPSQGVPKPKIQSTSGISNIVKQIASLQKPSLIYRTLIQDKEESEEACFRSERNQAKPNRGNSKSPLRPRITSINSKKTVESPSFDEYCISNSKERINSSIDKNSSQSNLDLLIANKLQKMGFSSASSLDKIRHHKPTSPRHADKQPTQLKADLHRQGSEKHQLIYPVLSKATNFSSKFFQSAQQICSIKETALYSGSKREINEYGRGSFRKQNPHQSCSSSDDTNPLDSAFTSQKIPLEPITEEAFPEMIKIVGEDVENDNEELETKYREETAKTDAEPIRPFFYPLVASNKVFFEGSRKQSEHNNQFPESTDFNPFLPSHKNSLADLEHFAAEQEVTIKIECEPQPVYIVTDKYNYDEPMNSDLQIHDQISETEDAREEQKSPAFASINPNINEYFSFEPNERLIKTTLYGAEDGHNTDKMFKLNLLALNDLEKSLALPEINAEAEELESSKDLTSTLQITPRIKNIWEKSKEGLLTSSLDELKAETQTWHVHSQSKRSDSEAGTNPMDSGNLINLQTNDSQLGSQKTSSKTATRYLNYHRRVSKSFTESGQVFPTMELNRKKSIVTTLLSLEKNLPKLNSAHISLQKSGIIEAVIANSYKALGKSTNDDRYAISLGVQSKFKNRMPSNTNKQSDSSSLISIFNGFGGNECADYLATQLHSRFYNELDCDGLLIQSANRIFAEVDRDILEQSKYACGDSSGASSLSLYFTGNSLISLNLGDSRCVLSSENGKKIADLTNDHRPDRLSEFNRIIENGGHLERVTLNSKTGEAETHAVRKFQEVKNLNSLEKNLTQGTFGRWRIFPSGASVARCFGFNLAKDPEFGGSPGVISTEPEVLDFELEDADFALLASNIISQGCL